MAKKKAAKKKTARRTARRKALTNDEMDKIIADGPEPGAVGVMATPVEIAYARAKSVLDEFGDELRAYPGVKSLDIGLKSEGGECTPVVAIRVHVEQKLDVQDLKANDVLPRYFQGVAIDVVTSGFLEELADEYLEGGDAIVRTDRPTRGGTVCILVRSLHPNTFGRPRLLTCAHVASGGDSPSIIDTSPNMIKMTEPPMAGRALRNVPKLKMRNWAYNQFYDCALVTPDRESIPGVLGVGKISRIHRVTEKDWGSTVCKVGKKTGKTNGRLLTHVSSSMPLPDGTFAVHHLEIEPIDQPFALGGDSGSPVLLNDQLIGILRAIAPNGNALAMQATWAAAALQFRLA